MRSDKLGVTGARFLMYRVLSCHRIIDDILDARFVYIHNAYVLCVFKIWRI